MKGRALPFPAQTQSVVLPESVRARLAPPVKLLQAGPWSARLVGDELAHISYAQQPVLRPVMAVAQDHDWCTFPQSLETATLRPGNPRTRPAPQQHGAVRRHADEPSGDGVPGHRTRGADRLHGQTHCVDSRTGHRQYGRPDSACCPTNHS